MTAVDDQRVSPVDGTEAWCSTYAYGKDDRRRRKTELGDVERLVDEVCREELVQRLRALRRLLAADVHLAKLVGEAGHACHLRRWLRRVTEIRGLISADIAVRRWRLLLLRMRGRAARWLETLSRGLEPGHLRLLRISTVAGAGSAGVVDQRWLRASRVGPDAVVERLSSICSFLAPSCSCHLVGRRWRLGRPGRRISRLLLVEALRIGITTLRRIATLWCRHRSEWSRVAGGD